MQPIIRYENKNLLVEQSDLISTALEHTFLTADIASASGTLTVANISGFAINQNLVINPFTENAEFVKTHASSAPSGTTITLAANTSYSHYAGEKVYLVKFNTIELTHATTTTGTKTVMTTSTGNGLVSLEADNSILRVADREYDSGYYFGRFINNIGATFTISGDTLTSSSHGLVNGDTLKLIAATTMPTGLSSTVVYYVVSKDTNTFKVSLTNGGSAVTASDTGTGTLTWYKCGLFSDPLIYTGWASNSVGYIVERAMRDLEVDFSAKLTNKDCYEWINSGMKLLQGKLKRWAEHYSYNTILGQVSRGTNIVSMPSDAYDTETNKSIIGLRIGDRRNLTYLDPRSFDVQMEGVKVTQVTTQAVAGATSLYIDNSYDFSDTGSVNVYISGTKYAIAYTGITRSATAGVLTGIDASTITVTIPADTYVWQDESDGVPQVFTVRNGNIEFYPLANADEDNTNIYCDYSKVATSVDSDGDIIDFQRFDMLQSYLTWRIWCKVENDGKLDQNNGYYLDFKERMNDAIRTMPQNNFFPMTPRINRMSRQPTFKRKADLQELSIDDQ